MRLICATALLAAGLACEASAEDAPFSGRWAPSCAPAPDKKVDTQLAGIVFYGGAVKFSDLECQISNWSKKKGAYGADLMCFSRNKNDPLKRRIAVRELKDGKIRIKVSDGAYKGEVERCGA